MATDQVTLLGMWASPLSLRIEWALKIKGIHYEYIDEDLDNKSQRLLTCNPVHKKVPVLVHAGKPIAESLVILEYIDETWSHSRILPEDPYERAMARFWAKFADDKCWTTIHGVFTKTGQEQENAKSEAIESLKTLEKIPRESKFFGGDAIGFLDIVFGWMAYWVPLLEEITGIILVGEDSLPSLKEWFKNFLDVPLVKELLPPREKLLHHLQTFRQKLITSSS
ncbi:PREDICTED: glutathione transferase GST 23-like [Nelumbo nucifera]|uniref:glutathione transferase n=2 Tax=Nelumbo nucifera TaxID=4432 RepID=A0A822ZCS1_NELNU|nr:PREDICTED: glutathione transferase GST 23-like [Nelumbo nucifera]DAD42932.1 TPA_asm: hypothetical protein HUJ06_001162 [Nelumbo nucifera]